MDSTKLSISEAARRAGVRRNTIYRKLESGKLSKETGDDGNPVIDLSELARLYPRAVSSAGQPPELFKGAGANSRNGAGGQADFALRELVDMLKQDKASLKEQLEQEHERNDRLMGLLEAAQRKLTGPMHTDPQPVTPPSPQPPRGLWARLTGRA
jgi:hypothetical protein